VTGQTLFVSDLHLSPRHPESTAWFTDFLQGEARLASALYILGDLFDYWIGDDAVELLQQTGVVEALRSYSEAQPNLYFMAGNRDFLVGPDFIRMTGCTLLRDETIIELNNERVLLMHGDSLCTADAEHQQFRKLVLDPQWQRTFLALPVQKRHELAMDAREQSALHKSLTSMEIMDVTSSAVSTVMRNHKVRRLIHGHTHRPAIHLMDIDGQPHERIVLGAWFDGPSVLRFTNGHYQLEPEPQNH